MAVIKLAPEKIWGASRWVFDNLIDRVTVRTPEGSSLRTTLSQVQVRGLYWMSLEELAEIDRSWFCREVIAVYEDLKRADESDFATVEGYEALKGKVAELVQMIHDMDFH